jgi:hypothetical protein
MIEVDKTGIGKVDGQLVPLIARGIMGGFGGVGGLGLWSLWQARAPVERERAVDGWLART